MKLKLIVVGLAVLTVGAVGGYAAIPSSTGSITACLNNKGALKVIDAEAGATCGTQRTLTWREQSAEPAGISGVHTVGETGPLSSLHVRAMFAHCAEGEVVVGGGAKAFTSANGYEYNPVHVSITQSYPTSNGWGVYANETTADFDAEWQLRAYVICAPAAA